MLGGGSLTSEMNNVESLAPRVHWSSQTPETDSIPSPEATGLPVFFFPSWLELYSSTFPGLATQEKCNVGALGEGAKVVM